MTWMIGIDEAGYGPNLGPLVVAATVWRIGCSGVRGQGSGSSEHGVGNIALASTATSAEPKVDLYQRLAGLVSRQVEKNRLAIADSKTLYKPRGGLQHLERGVLSALAVANDGSPPTRWRELITHDSQLPWYAEYDCPLPIDASTDEVALLVERLQEVCEEAEASLTDVRTRLVFPNEFNTLIEKYGTKSAALSHVTIALLRHAIESLPPPPSPFPPPHISVTCDKHGARNRYAALLQHHFPDHWIETYEESGAQSRYAWGLPEQRTFVTFRVRAEAELHTALASMTAKYHRELAMRAFNAFWCSEVNGLTPTAGYPQDAKRFKQAIAAKQRQLGISDVQLWRNR